MQAGRNELLMPRLSRALQGALSALREALRAWRRAPCLAIGLAVLLAVGIGAAAGMLALADRVLLRPLPLPHPQNVVLVGGAADPPNGLSAVAYYSRSPALASLCQFGSTGVAYAAGGRSGFAYLALVSPGFFRFAEAAPERGRVFSASEERAGAPVAIVSHRFWKRELGGGAALGHTVMLDKTPFTIIGVMPTGFRFPAQTAIWTPQHIALSPAGRQERGLPFGFDDYTMAARLRPGATDKQAIASLDQLMDAAFADSKVLAGGGVWVQSLAAAWSREFSSSLTILLLAAGFLWFIACADAGWILLVRTVARRREAAVRTVLGAGRASLLGQLLAECGWLVVWGACGGLGVALALIAAVRHWGPAAMPGMGRPLLGPIAVGIAGLAALSLVILCGTGAITMLRADMMAALRQQPLRGSILLPHAWAALVAVQIGAALVLAGGAGVLLFSLHRLTSVPLGFSARQVASLEYAIPAAIPRRKRPASPIGGAAMPHTAAKNPAHPPCPLGRTCGPAWYAAVAAARTGDRQVLAAAQREPGILAAAISDQPPLLRGPGYEWVHSAGSARRAGTMAVANDIGGEYLRTLQIPLVRGRNFGAGDNFDSQPVAILSTTLAKRLWGDRNPIGRRLRVGNESGWRTVVGIAGAVRDAGAKSSVLDQQQIYLPFAQPYFQPEASMVLLVRPRAPGAMDFGSLRRRIASIPGVTPLEGTTMRAAAAEVLAPAAFWALIATGATALGAAMAWLGVLGLFANWVAQHRHEIGIRLALGATARAVFGSILERAALVTIGGIVLGLLGGVAEAGLLAHLVFEVQPLDGRIWAIAAAFVVIAVFAAAVIPGLRAAAIDPARELRRE